MSLISEINRTETEKNKTKQVAVNIDNKLIELGGERATDLADVPNKIEILTNEYTKYALIKMFKRGTVYTNPKVNNKSNPTIIKINFDKQLEFLPETAYLNLGELSISNQYEEAQGVVNNLEYKRIRIHTRDFYFKIGKIEKASIELNLYVDYNTDYNFELKYAIRQIECFSKIVAGKEY